MAKFWLNRIAEARTAFSTQPSPEEAVADAVAVLQSIEAQDTGMGFHKLETLVREIADVKRLLAEHNLELEDGEIEQLMGYLKELDEMKKARIRLWIQAGFSVLLMGVALAILGLGNPPEALARGLFALLGTVVGFWLS